MTGPIRVTVTSDDERKRAIERAAALMGCAAGSEEERELEALTEAIALYDIEIRNPGTIAGPRRARN